jgi:hypothetical protein
VTEASKRYPTPVELLEQHGFHGDRLVAAVMEVTSTGRQGALDQIRSAHGEFRGDMRIVAAPSRRTA